MREFVNFIFHNDFCFFLLCFLLTFTPIYGIIIVHSIKNNNE
jgi:hypothetical protein